MSFLKMLMQIVRAIVAAFRGSPQTSTVGQLPEATVITMPPEKPTTTNPVTLPGVPMAVPAPTPVPPSSPIIVGADPNRRGSFIIPDIYPRDLGPNPAYRALPGKVIDGKHEVIGCIIKASEGLGWGESNEEWFKRGWKQIRDAAPGRYGVDWFRGCYHFLRFSVDGAAQADYFLKLVEEAGGWGEGDIMPMVDAEEGGQGDWAGGEKLESIKDPAKRQRLANEVIACVSKFTDRVRERTGMRILLYGRGIMRDLHINNRMHCDAVCNPAYTSHMPPMDAYGWPLKDVPLWQLCGDGTVFCPGFSGTIPGWGKTDYSVYIDGANQTDLTTFRQRLLAKPR
jgi:GH25 family lysozyme M1 (1,4-beta-N-acetylmuramidase)